MPRFPSPSPIPSSRRMPMEAAALATHAPCHRHLCAPRRLSSSPASTYSALAGAAPASQADTASAQRPVHLAGHLPHLRPQNNIPRILFLRRKVHHKRECSEDKTKSILYLFLKQVKFPLTWHVNLSLGHWHVDLSPSHMWVGPAIHQRAN